MLVCPIPGAEAVAAWHAIVHWTLAIAVSVSGGGFLVAGGLAYRRSAPAATEVTHRSR